MMIKLKPWNEVVELAKEHDVYDCCGNAEYVFGLDKNVLPWGGYIESATADENGDYFVDGRWWVKGYMVEHAAFDDILRYGEIIADDAYASVVTEFGRRQSVRIRLISYDGRLWYHKMVSGNVVDCRYVGKAI